MKLVVGALYLVLSNVEWVLRSIECPHDDSSVGSDGYSCINRCRVGGVIDDMFWVSHMPGKVF